MWATSVKLDGAEKICYIAREVIEMAKLNSSLTGKLKDMARSLKDEDDSKGTMKKLGEKIKSAPDARRKEVSDGGKLSGRKG
ncbi:MAG: hypothetical protein SR2Q5_04855 [Quinella sp. 2Q5]|nr:hypothetical protein [Quinella sp. 2Q5]